MFDVDDYFSKFQNALFDVEENNLIQYSIESGAPLSYDDEASNAAARAIPLPQSVLQLYESRNGVQLTWQAARDTDICGRMHFLEMKYVLQDWEEAGLFTKDDVDNGDYVLKPGDYVSINDKGHSTIFVEWVTEGVTFKAINGNNGNQVSIDNFSWANVSENDGIGSIYGLVY